MRRGNRRSKGGEEDRDDKDEDLNSVEVDSDLFAQLDSYLGIHFKVVLKCFSIDWINSMQADGCTWTVK